MTLYNLIEIINNDIFNCKTFKISLIYKYKLKTKFEIHSNFYCDFFIFIENSLLENIKYNINKEPDKVFKNINLDFVNEKNGIMIMDVNDKVITFGAIKFNLMKFKKYMENMSIDDLIEINCSENYLQIEFDSRTKINLLYFHLLFGDKNKIGANISKLLKHYNETKINFTKDFNKYFIEYYI